MPISCTTFQKGHKHSPETIEKIKLARARQVISKETISSMANANKGKKRPEFSKEWREKMSKSSIGKNKREKHYLWIEDRTKLKEVGDRRSSIYANWRKQVWLRDNFKCKIANPDCAGRIEAHHILGYTEYPELRYQINNGITLCHAHHPRKRAEEKRLIPTFMELVSVSK